MNGTNSEDNTSLQPTNDSAPDIRGGQKEHRKLLLLSDFCRTNGNRYDDTSRRNRRISKKKKKNRRRGYEYEVDSELSNQAYDRLLSGVPVSVHILQTIPTGNDNGRATPIFMNVEQNGSENGSSNDNDYNEPLHQYIDPFATIYTSDIRLLHDLQIFDGQVCILYSTSTGEKLPTTPQQPQHCLTSPVIVKVLPSASNLTTVDQNQNNNETTSMKQRYQQYQRGTNQYNYHIFVPPVLAAMIGLHSTTLPCHSSTNKVYITSKIFNLRHRVPRPLLLSPPAMNFETISVASNANVVEFGRGPTDFIVDLEDIYDRKTQSKFHTKYSRRLHDEALKEYFYDIESNYNGVIKKKNGHRLVSIGSIFAVQTEHSSFDFEKETCKSNNYFFPDNHREMGMESMIRFYKVIHVEGNNSTQYLNDKAIYWLSPETQITLSQTDEGSNNTTNHTTSLVNYCERLPQPSIVNKFVSSLKEALCHDYCKGEDGDESGIFKHHSFSTKMARILLALSVEPSCNIYYGTKALLSHQMIHVIGDDEVGLNACLDGAADKGE